MNQIYNKIFCDNATLSNSTSNKISAHKQIYFMHVIPRSGSTFLTELCSKTDTLATPQEWFNLSFLQSEKNSLNCPPPRALSISDINKYIEYISNTHSSLSKTVGLQFSHYQLKVFLEHCEDKKLPQISKHMIIRRKNILAQAISLYRSSESNFWHNYQQGEVRENYKNITFDSVKILERLDFLVKEEIKTINYLNSKNLKYLTVFYEDLSDDPISTLDKISMYINGSKPNIQNIHLESLTVKKIADVKNSQWEQEILNFHSKKLNSITRDRAAF